MKKIRPLILVLITVGCLNSSSTVYSQSQCHMLQVSNVAAVAHNSTTNYWFGVMELPFLFISVFFAFMTAYALRGGKFGKGMKFMAWGLSGLGFWSMYKASRGA